MRSASRYAIGALLVLIIPLLVLIGELADRADQYKVPAYLQATFLKAFHNGISDLDSPEPIDVEVGDKVIVMAKLESEDTSWVADHLHDWQSAIYTVNPTNATTPNALRTPINKGHEAMAYLTYIIQNYPNLPRTIVFLHSHASGFLSAWHTDTALHSNVHALRVLQIPFVQHNGYVNLRCNWNPGCEKRHRKSKHITPSVYTDVFSSTSTSITNLTSASIASNLRNESYIDGSTLKSEAELKARFIPTEVGVACCAQFAVSREQVHRRPRTDYETFRQWIIETELNDAKSGRVFEYLWHVIFGMEAVYCPVEEICYCQVYGQC